MSCLQQNSDFIQPTYSPEQHKIWQKLYDHQYGYISENAHPDFFNNLKKFDLPAAKIPTLKYISEKMYAATGWRAEPVEGIVGYLEYFNLLKEKLFPVAIFIRPKTQEKLSVDPDIFHEVFGHCTMLLSSDYADFMQEYAKFALTVPKHDRALFARLIWFTTETGLISLNGKLKIYGASIISSSEESRYCLQSNQIEKKSFDLVSIFREPYRADILQKVYYVLDNVNNVYSLLDDVSKLFSAIQKARMLGEFPANFPIIKNKYANVGHCKLLPEYEEAILNQ